MKHFLPSLTSRHLFLLGTSFLIVQLLTSVWLIWYWAAMQTNMNLNNRAKLFCQTYMLMLSLTPEERLHSLGRFTTMKSRFHISEEAPRLDEDNGPENALFRYRILAVLSVVHKDLAYAFDQPSPWKDFSPQAFLPMPWAGDDAETFKKNAPLVSQVFSSYTSPSLNWGAIPLPEDSDGKIDLSAIAALPLEDGTWLVGDFLENPLNAADTTALIFSLLTQFLILMLVVWAEIKLLVRPLAELEHTAARINLDSPEEFPAPEGSYREIQSLAHSLRGLTHRLSQQTKERFTILTSLSHDLRSPVSRMRVEVEKMEEQHPEIMTRSGLSTALDDLQQLMDSVLDYVRSGHNSEQPVPMGMDSLLRSLAEDYQDSGFCVNLLRADTCRITLYPQSIRRCLQNLIQNALDYAKTPASESIHGRPEEYANAENSPNAADFESRHDRPQEGTENTGDYAKIPASESIHGRPEEYANAENSPNAADFESGYDRPQEGAENTGGSESKDRLLEYANAADYAKTTASKSGHYRLLEWARNAADSPIVNISGEDQGDFYCIRIRDFGPGLPEKDLERVFEPFVRMETSRSRTTGGTGLGLSIARNLAQVNHGTLSLSNCHPGLQVTICLKK